MAAPAGPSTPLRPKQPFYCSVCTFPIEYCEFGPKSKKCKTWLSKEHPDLYQNFYSDTAISEKMSSLSVEQQQAIEKDIAKKEAKETAKEEQAEKKRKASKVTIKRVERNKRKYITAVHGLDAFGLDLKKAAKTFANKFATGSSVSKNNQGEDEITIQGDVAEEIADMLQDTSPKIAAVLGGGKVPSGNVAIVDDKKKKTATAAD